MRRAEQNAGAAPQVVQWRATDAGGLAVTLMLRGRVFKGELAAAPRSKRPAGASPHGPTPGRVGRPPVILSWFAKADLLVLTAAMQVCNDRARAWLSTAIAADCGTPHRACVLCSDV